MSNKPFLDSMPNMEKYFIELSTIHPEIKTNVPYRKEKLIELIKQFGIENDELIGPILTEEVNFPSPTDVGVYHEIRCYPPIWHSHSYFEIVSVLKGSTTNYFYSEKLELKAGDFLIVAPETSHAVATYNLDTYAVNVTVRSSTFASVFWEILHGDDKLSLFFKNALYGLTNNSYILFRVGENEELVRLVTKMIEEFYNEELHYRRMLNAYFAQFIVHLLRIDEKNIVLPNSDMKNYAEFQNILRYIRLNFRDISVQNVAEKFGYSERHISRLIKNKTGETPNSIINSLKLQEATRLLVDEKYTVQEAASLAGYTNINNFYRAFNKKYGLPPLEYIKNKI